MRGAHKRRALRAQCSERREHADQPLRHDPVCVDDIGLFMPDRTPRGNELGGDEERHEEEAPAALPQPLEDPAFIRQRFEALGRIAKSPHAEILTKPFLDGSAAAVRRNHHDVVCRRKPPAQLEDEGRLAVPWPTGESGRENEDPQPAGSYLSLSLKLSRVICSDSRPTTKTRTDVTKRSALMFVNRFVVKYV
jgi:hypothetical protein